MKLNNNGWGIKAMVAFILMFVLCLLLAAHGIYKVKYNGESPLHVFFFGEKNNENNNDSFNNHNFNTITNSGKNYVDLQQELVDASKKYFSEKYNNQIDLDRLVITVNNLQNNNYILDFKDLSQKKCTGYAEIMKDETGNISYNPYIKCKKYQTSGYLEYKDIK